MLAQVRQPLSLLGRWLLCWLLYAIRVVCACVCGWVHAHVVRAGSDSPVCAEAFDCHHCVQAVGKAGIVRSVLVLQERLYTGVFCAAGSGVPAPDMVSACCYVTRNESKLCCCRCHVGWTDGVHTGLLGDDEYHRAGFWSMAVLCRPGVCGAKG